MVIDYRGQRSQIPAPPAGEATATFETFDPDSGNPLFRRADGSVFEVEP